MRLRDLRRLGPFASREFPSREHARRYEGEEESCRKRRDAALRSVHGDAREAGERERDRDQHGASPEASAARREGDSRPRDRARGDHRRPHVREAEPSRHLPLQEPTLVEPCRLAALRPTERGEDLGAILLEVRDRRGMLEEPLLGAAGEPRHRARDEPGEEDRAERRERVEMRCRDEADPRRRKRASSPRLLEVVRAVPREDRHRHHREHERGDIDPPSASRDAQQHQRRRQQEQRIETEA